MSKVRQSWVQASRTDWGPLVEADGNLHLSAEQVGVGCLMRIAACVESMAGRFKKLCDSIDARDRRERRRRQLRRARKEAAHA